jgi:hypothetical protein
MQNVIPGCKMSYLDAYDRKIEGFATGMPGNRNVIFAYAKYLPA